jgi:tRNA(Ile)-lysidine synthase
VAHFNHGLRGKDADEDEAFVKGLAEKLALPFHAGRGDVKKRRVEEGESLEEAAREARFHYLTTLSIELKAQKIALGHTLDDQAETILHRILRGTGLRGLKGMSPIRVISKKHDLFVVRPLIEVERWELEKFLYENSLKFRTDATNADTTLTRNRLRHKLIPTLEREFNPRVKSALVKLGQTAGSFYLLLREIANEVYENTKMLAAEGEVALNVDEFAKLPPAIQTLIIDKAMKQILGYSPQLNFEHYVGIISLCGEQGHGKAIRLPKGLEARRESYIVLIHKPVEAVPPLKFAGKKLSVPGRTVIKKLNIQIDAEILDSKLVGLKDYIRNKDYTEEVLDYDKVRGPLRVRLRQRGDQFTPLGARGTTKLKKFFIDNKVPQPMRDRVPILADEKKILWVVGYRLGDSVKVTDATSKVLKLKVSRLEEGAPGDEAKE